MTPYVSVCRIDRTSEGKEPARTVERDVDRYSRCALKPNRKYRCKFYANLSRRRQTGLTRSWNKNQNNVLR